MKQQILLAADAGGSKTAYCLKFLPGGERRYLTFGGSNYKVSGIEVARENLITRLLQALEGEGIGLQDIQGAVFGIAGLDVPEDARVYGELIAELGLGDRAVIYNDCELAFLATARAPGLCLVAGTGSNCMAFHPSRPMIQVGGMGAFLSDGGSGFWIAQQVMRDMLRFADGVIPGRPLYDVVARHFGVGTTADIPLRFAVMEVPEIATAARVIIAAATEGDPDALAVVNGALEQLWELARTAMGRMAYEPGETLDVVLNGSLFKGRWFLDAFWQGLTAQTKNPLRQHLVTCNTSDTAMGMAEQLFGRTSL